jgi:hypothetical protein
MNSTSSSSYSLRPPTLANQDKGSITPYHRRKLKLNDTASLVRSLNHQCNDHEVANTRVKMDIRIFTTFQRFLYAHVTKSKTSRGRTSYTGSIAPCSQRCQAAHASLTPTLKDDKMAQITSVIAQSRLNHLSPYSKQYLACRFGTDITNTHGGSGVDEDEKENILPLIKKTSRGRSQRSLNENVQFALNTTVENPRSANRVDCQVERLLRPFEDILANICTEQKATPEYVMDLFMKKYTTFLETAETNLSKKQKEFDEFVALETRILHSKTHINENDYGKFIENIRRFLVLKTLLSEKLQGTPSYLKTSMRFFHKKSLYAPLETIVKNFDQEKDKKDAFAFYTEIKNQLDDPQINVDVAKIQLDLKNRLIEIQTQLHKLREAQNDIPDMQRLFFGVMGPDKIRRAPTREEIQEHFLSQLDVIDTDFSRRSVRRNLSFMLDAIDKNTAPTDY